MENSSDLYLWGKNKSFVIFCLERRDIQRCWCFNLVSSFSMQTEVVSAKFVMKTDDDAFVRVDEVLDSLKRINANHGLLYGLINSESQPHRDPNSKWFISPEVKPCDSLRYLSFSGVDNTLFLTMIYDLN